MPDQVLGEQVIEGGEITLGEGGVAVCDASDVGMLGHGLPLLVADLQQAGALAVLSHIFPQERNPRRVLPEYTYPLAGEAQRDDCGTAC